MPISRRYIRRTVLDSYTPRYATVHPGAGCPPAGGDKHAAGGDKHPAAGHKHAESVAAPGGHRRETRLVRADPVEGQIRPKVRSGRRSDRSAVAVDHPRAPGSKTITDVIDLRCPDSHRFTLTVLRRTHRRSGLRCRCGLRGWDETRGHGPRGRCRAWRRDAHRRVRTWSSCRPATCSPC